MVRMRPVSMILASASLAVLLSACGGGSDIHPGDQTAQAPSASNKTGNNNVAPNASGYWQLAGRIFQRSGQSEQSTVDVNDHVESTLEIHGRIPPATPVNGAAGSVSSSTTGTPVATETLDSLLRVEFTGRTAGTYKITTDANRFQNAGRQARLAVLRVAVRDTTTRQETSYIATAGTIEVTVGADRKFHVRSVTDLPVRQLSISQAAGGVTAMPAQTQLSIRD